MGVVHSLTRSCCIGSSRLQVELNCMLPNVRSAVKACHCVLQSLLRQSFRDNIKTFENIIETWKEVIALLCHLVLSADNAYCSSKVILPTANFNVKTIIQSIYLFFRWCICWYSRRQSTWSPKAWSTWVLRLCLWLFLEQTFKVDLWKVHVLS